MKKAIGSLLIIAVIAAALTGCGKNEQKTSLEDFSIVTTSADKVILDCDMGYVNDDAFALMFLLQADRSGYVDLLGVTVSGGNKLGAVGVNGALLQLEKVERTDIPVYIGQDEPLKGFQVERAQRSGYLSGAYADLDNYVSPGCYHDLGQLYNKMWGYSQMEAQSESSAEFMTEQVKKYPGEITILCIGPATNVALACMADDSFAENTAGIIYMGGSVSGNSSFNWQYDADAVKICLESPFPCQIVCTSEISDTMVIPPQFIDGLSVYENSAVAAFFVKYKQAANSNKKLWDVVIPAVFLCPELISKSEERAAAVSVEDESYGETKFTEEGTKVTIISEVNGPDVFALMEILYGMED